MPRMTIEIDYRGKLKGGSRRSHAHARTRRRARTHSRSFVHAMGDQPEPLLKATPLATVWPSRVHPAVALCDGDDGHTPRVCIGNTPPHWLQKNRKTDTKRKKSQSIQPRSSVACVGGGRT
eukprot:COSAG01_NODE_29269_length_641_cov_1.239852_1_plen_120_part_10